jgi:hypothetical protein
MRSCVCELHCVLEDGDAAPYAVIARSEATKQSRVPLRKDPGLLRCARNDEEEGAAGTIPSRHPEVRALRRDSDTAQASKGDARLHPGCSSFEASATLRHLRMTERMSRPKQEAEPATSPRLWRDRIGSTKNPLSTVARRTLMNQPRLVHKRRPAAGGSPLRRVLG